MQIQPLIHRNKGTVCEVSRETEINPALFQNNFKGFEKIRKSEIDSKILEKEKNMKGSGFYELNLTNLNRH